MNKIRLLLSMFILLPALVVFAFSFGVYNRLTDGWFKSVWKKVFGTIVTLVSVFCNFTVSYVLWGYKPGIWLFTDTVNFYSIKKDPLAMRIGRIMNKWDPGHVYVPSSD